MNNQEDITERFDEFWENEATQEYEEYEKMGQLLIESEKEEKNE